MGDTYPELIAHEERINTLITAEAEKFGASLEKGMREFEKHTQITGSIAFDLYQSYGFPWEVTHELAIARGMTVDKAEFESEFAKHKELSRTASAGTFKGGLADNSEIVVRYHTATHLLNAALRQVLGDHVMQKGSNINAERLRFDFSHPAKVTSEELARIAELVNQWIAQDAPVTRTTMTRVTAIALGAIGAFGEKYGETVSVYTVGDADHPISREFCGGPHVEHTGVIGTFTIIKEEAVSAGVRRIKATLS